MATDGQMQGAAVAEADGHRAPCRHLVADRPSGQTCGLDVDPQRGDVLEPQAQPYDEAMGDDFRRASQRRVDLTLLFGLRVR